MVCIFNRIQVIDHNPLSVFYGVHGELSSLFCLMNLELTHGLESIVVVGVTKKGYSMQSTWAFCL
jgi:hypothetical protein